jgi:hypothetical protein
MEGPLKLFANNDRLSNQAVSFKQVLHCAITWHSARLHPSRLSLDQLTQTRENKCVAYADVSACYVDEYKFN